MKTRYSGREFANIRTITKLKSTAAEKGYEPQKTTFIKGFEVPQRRHDGQTRFREGRMRKFNGSRVSAEFIFNPAEA